MYFVKRKTHAERFSTCKELLKSFNKDASKINQNVTYIDDHAYSIMGMVLHTLSLSPKADIVHICMIARRLLALGANPNILAYWIHTAPGKYSCYERVLILSHSMQHGDLLDSLLKAFKDFGGEVPWHTFDTWKYKLQKHAIFKNANISICRHVYPGYRSGKTHTKEETDKSWAWVKQQVLAALNAIISVPACFVACRQGKTCFESPTLPCSSLCPMLCRALPTFHFKMRSFKCTKCKADGDVVFTLYMHKDQKTSWAQCVACGEYNLAHALLIPKIPYSQII